jgi:DNA-binding PadR family transcriptional regulator
MPLQHAVLALLADGPSHGYDLRERFEQAVGPQWGLNVGHLYQVLDRLRRDGLVSAQVVAQAHRPDRTVYRITGAGVDELESWLAKPAGRTRGYRDDFFLKLMAAARRGRPALDAVIRAQRERHLQELRSLADVRAGGEVEVLTGLLIEAATLHTKADLAVVDLAEERATALVAAGASEPPGQEADAEAEPRIRRGGP